MPTLIGWAGASATIDGQAWLLFAILFLWQFPHFLAIALMYREDYDRAGYRMLPSFDADARFTHAEIIAFSAVLMIVTMLPGILRGGAAYTIGMALAGMFMLYYSLGLLKSNSRRLAARLVHASVIYLPVVLAIMMFAKG
jgi:protoheme IX farnesyltransferase